MPKITLTPPGKMQVTIKMPVPGSSFSLELAGDDSPGAIKALIRGRLRPAIIASGLDLSFCGTKLENNRYLADYAVASGSVLRCTLMPGRATQGPWRVHVVLPSAERQVVVLATGMCTVAGVKAQLPPAPRGQVHRLYLDGVTLEDEVALVDYGLSQDSTLHLSHAALGPGVDADVAWVSAESLTTRTVTMPPELHDHVGFVVGGGGRACNNTAAIFYATGSHITVAAEAVTITGGDVDAAADRVRALLQVKITELAELQLRRQSPPRTPSPPQRICVPLPEALVAHVGMLIGPGRRYVNNMAVINKATGARITVDPEARVVTLQGGDIEEATRMLRDLVASTLEWAARTNLLPAAPPAPATVIPQTPLHVRPPPAAAMATTMGRYRATVSLPDGLDDGKVALELVGTDFAAVQARTGCDVTSHFNARVIVCSGGDFFAAAAAVQAIVKSVAAKTAEDESRHRAEIAAATEAGREEGAACSICYDAEKDTLLEPCSHQMCRGCAEKLSTRSTQEACMCPFCQQHVVGLRAIFRS